VTLLFGGRPQLPLSAPGVASTRSLALSAGILLSLIPRELIGLARGGQLAEPSAPCIAHRWLAGTGNFLCGALPPLVVAARVVCLGASLLARLLDLARRAFSVFDDLPCLLDVRHALRAHPPPINSRSSAALHAVDAAREAVHAALARSP
jgi:hypothetical protein